MSVPDEIESAFDLKEAVKARLLKSGAWREIQAKLRSEVFHAVNDESVSAPEKGDELTLATDLIMDFMHALRMDNSTSVFTEESGASVERGGRIDRSQLGVSLGLDVIDNQGDVPLLLIIIQNLLAQKKTREIHYNTAMMTQQEF